MGPGGSLPQDDPEPPASPGDPGPIPKRARLGCALLALALLALALAALYHSRSLPGTAGPGPSARPPQAVPVSVARAERRDVPVHLHLVGNVLPYRTVAVTSQVNGQILRVLFQQGDYVRKGQLLFQVDPRTLESSLDQARANLERDRAQLHQARMTVARDQVLVEQARSNRDKDRAQKDYAQAEDRRYASLLEEGSVTSEQTEQVHANLLSLVATLRADEAAVAAAQANLRVDQASLEVLSSALKADQAAERSAAVQRAYTDIEAPMDGRTGNLNLYPGAVVQANSSTPLVTLNQVQPVFVAFAVPEQYLEPIQRLQALRPLAVEAALADPGPSAQRGEVSFIDNTVDPSTGTITLRATFPNPSRLLWPGHYVDVTLDLGTQRNATVVPQQAVQPGQKGDYVFVVRRDLTVESRPVVVDRSEAGLSALRSGLKPGERVVTDGQMQLVPGSRVTIRSSGPGPASPGRTPGREPD